jgi:hypothetical protein
MIAVGLGPERLRDETMPGDAAEGVQHAGIVHSSRLDVASDHLAPESGLPLRRRQPLGFQWHVSLF